METRLKFGCSFSISLTFVLETFCDFCANCAVKNSVTSRPCFVPPSEQINRPIRTPALLLHGFFGTNIVTSFQLACQLNWQSTAPVLQRSWIQIPYRPEFFSGLIFITAQVVMILRRSLSYSRLHPQFTYMIFMYSQVFKIFYKAKYVFHCWMKIVFTK